jgi:hypothetical protein
MHVHIGTNDRAPVRFPRERPRTGRPFGEGLLEEEEAINAALTRIREALERWREAQRAVGEEDRGTGEVEK